MNSRDKCCFDIIMNAKILKRILKIVQSHLFKHWKELSLPVAKCEFYYYNVTS